MRLPLVEVMVHPWVTVEGTAPLVPYNEPLIDEQLWDKVQILTAIILLYYYIWKSASFYGIQLLENDNRLALHLQKEFSTNT